MLKLARKASKNLAANQQQPAVLAPQPRGSSSPRIIQDFPPPRPTRPSISRAATFSGPISTKPATRAVRPTIAQVRSVNLTPGIPQLHVSSRRTSAQNDHSNTRPHQQSQPSSEVLQRPKIRRGYYSQSTPMSPKQARQRSSDDSSTPLLPPPGWTPFRDHLASTPLAIASPSPNVEVEQAPSKAWTRYEAFPQTLTSVEETSLIPRQRLYFLRF